MTDSEKRDREGTEMDNRMVDAGDVIEGEVGSARLKEPTRVEAEGARPESETLPEGAVDVQGTPPDVG